MLKLPRYHTSFITIRRTVRATMKDLLPQFWYLMASVCWLIGCIWKVILILKDKG